MGTQAEATRPDLFAELAEALTVGQLRSVLEDLEDDTPVLLVTAISHEQVVEPVMCQSVEECTLTREGGWQHPVLMLFDHVAPHACQSDSRWTMAE